jgi:hypothetical protein
VRAVRFAGATSLVTVELAGGEIEAACDGESPEVGSAVGVRLRAGAAPRLFFAAEGA